MEIEEKGPKKGICSEIPKMSISSISAWKILLFVYIINYPPFYDIEDLRKKEVKDSWFFVSFFQNWHHRHRAIVIIF